MRPSLILPIILLLSGCALPAIEPGCEMLMPPLALDHEPTAAYLPLNLSSADIPEYCGKRVVRDRRIERLEACSVKTQGGNWLRVLPKDGPESRRACLARHENGHINGGDSQHTGWHYER